MSSLSENVEMLADNYLQTCDWVLKKEPEVEEMVTYVHGCLEDEKAFDIDRERVREILIKQGILIPPESHEDQS